MSETTVVDARLDKLEQDNGRLKLTVGALLLVMAAMPLVGAVMPEQRPQVVRASTFRTIDGNGKERAYIGTDGIAYADENGGENGNNRAYIGTDGIAYYDENGTIRAWMNDTGFVSFGENGEVVWRSSEWQ